MGERHDGFGGEGGHGEDGRRRDSCVKREVTCNENEIIDIRPNPEEGSSKRPTNKKVSGKGNCEKRQETNPDPDMKKTPSWTQGGLRDTVQDIITVGLTKKILRLKLKKTQVSEVVTVSVSPPPTTVELSSPCEDRQDQQRTGYDLINHHPDQLLPASNLKLTRDQQIGSQA